MLLKRCPICDNEYLTVRTDRYKDGREFVYCDVCGATATLKLWDMLAPLVNQPPECVTIEEKTAYAFGWFKALESLRTSK